MKKLLILASVSIILFGFSSCKSREKIMEPNLKAEQEMAELKEKVSELEKEIGGTREEKKKSTEITEKTIKKIEQGISFIKLDNTPANKSTVTQESVKFTGTVSPDVTKIVVTASSEGTDGEIIINDHYQLKNFKKEDKAFYYNAKVDWGNLVVGNNFYEFEAFLEDESVGKVKISIHHPAMMERFIELLEPKEGESFKGGKIEFKGKVSPNVKKIVVTATGSKLKDVYELQNFEPGDTEFVYKAKKKLKNIAKGSNKYEFKAYFLDKTTDTDVVTIFYSDN